MANVKKFNVSHGLSAGSGNNLKNVVDSTGKVLDVGTLSDLKTSDKDNVVEAINSLYDYAESVDTRSRVASEPMGIENRSHSTISFNPSTRTFTISPAAGYSEFTVWTKGVRRVINSPRSVSLGTSAASGLYYIYFNASGVLSVRTSYFDWENDTMVAYVYWNATTQEAPFIADERHGIVLDWQTHEYLHRTRGAVISDGFSIGEFTTSGDGSNDAHAQFDLGGGTFFDEDLQVDISHSATPALNSWEQDLQGPARIPMFYLDGTHWVRDLPTDFALKQGGSRIKYNLLSGGSWSNTDVPTDSWYTSSWIIATNNINYPVISIMGQSAHSAITDQEALTFNDLSLPNFPIVEFRPLWKVIWQTSSSYTNSPKARIAGVYDIRNLSSVGVSGLIQSDHGLLTGLSDDDHAQYVHTSIDRTISANHTVTGSLKFSGGLKDSLNSAGTAGQFLVSNGTTVEWKYPSTTNVLFVSKNGNDSNSGTSLQNSKLTIKSALQSATSGTVIKVSAGSYVENNPLIIPEQVSVVGDSLREVSVIPQNSGDLFYVSNGSYVSNMSFTSPTPNSGAIFSFNPNNAPYIDQSPYIQNCTNFIRNSIGLRIDGDHCVGQLKSMVVDSYTQYNQGGIGAKILNDGYAQLVSMFTICCDKAIECLSGGGCDLTNSNSSFGTYGLIADGVSDLKYTGSVVNAVQQGDSVVRVNISTPEKIVTNATYVKTTGLLTVTTSTSHNFTAGMDVELRDLTFSCTSNGSSSSQLFPSGAYGYVFTVNSVLSSTQFTLKVGSSDIDHTYVPGSGGTVKIRNTRPFDGQAIYINSLYYRVERVNITNGGSGYTTAPLVSIAPSPESWGINAIAVAEIANGSVTAVQIVSSGTGYSSTPPSITIEAPQTGTQATALVELSPSYFLIQESAQVSSDVFDITLKESVPVSLAPSDTVYFYKQSRLLASGHSFEYIGSGTDINTALPRNGGQPIQENEIKATNGGLVIYTSTDHSGNFRIGDGVVIDQASGFISGDSYSRSLFSNMTPFILALGA